MNTPDTAACSGTATASTDGVTEARSALTDALSVPELVIVDGQHVTQRPIDDLIAADAYLRKSAAFAQRNSGLKITKLTHTGA